MAGIIGVAGIQAAAVTPPDTRFMAVIMSLLIMPAVMPAFVAAVVARVVARVVAVIDIDIRLNHSSPIKTPH
ncbi:MAG: hypothetical protein ACLP7P_13150 [Rhodomicrobium sp.]